MAGVVSGQQMRNAYFPGGQTLPTPGGPSSYTGFSSTRTAH